jgi:CRISPR system Cascade subunit CasA
VVSAGRFDLRECDWIPVRATGVERDVGFRELLVHAHELTDVDLPLAPAAAGFWRVLYLLAGRVSGLDDSDLSGPEFVAARRELLRAGRFDEREIDRYFAQHEGRFDLFDRERPWLQEPRLRAECAVTSGVNRIVMGRAAGSNQVWFGHHHDLRPEPIPAREAAWHLLAALYYGPSGRCTTRTVRSRSEANVTAGPLRGGLSCHPVGRTVFESLVAGIPTPDGADAYRYSLPDVAQWESAELPDPLRGPVPLRGLSRRLTGRFQHAVLLVPDSAGETVVDATLTWAWREKIPPVEDPYLIYQTSKKGDVYPRPASVSRALWRDLDALLREGNADERHQPTVIAAAKYLPGDVLGHLGVRVFGFDQDGQTRDKQFFSQTTPGVLRWLREQDADFVVGIGRLRDAAEQAGLDLVRALKAAWALQADPADDGIRGPSRLDGDIGPWVAAAEGRYWPAAERLFWRALDEAELSTKDDRFAELADGFPDLALRVYDEIAEQIGARVHVRMIRALARNRYRVRARLRPRVGTAAGPATAPAVGNRNAQPAGGVGNGGGV